MGIGIDNGSTSTCFHFLFSFHTWSLALCYKYNKGSGIDGGGTSNLFSLSLSFHFLFCFDFYSCVSIKGVALMMTVPGFAFTFFFVFTFTFFFPFIFTLFLLSFNKGSGIDDGGTSNLFSLSLSFPLSFLP